MDGLSPYIDIEEMIWERGRGGFERTYIGKYAMPPSISNNTASPHNMILRALASTV